jgi:hypothetical protein
VSFPKPKHQGEAALLHQATRNLLRAVKRKAAKNGKPLRKSELVKQGYGKCFIARLEEA